ncbi:MAG: beta-phosphoglucomutase [Anaerolineaceae bacterium]|nr:beta-phosphoglucomutase [Anaerolineaceae bacterium]
MIQAFLFDLDGVLTDTSEYHYMAWKHLADDLKIPFTREDNELLRGVSRRESLNRLLKGRAMDEAQIEKRMADKNRYYQSLIEDIREDALLPGALEMLVELGVLGLKRMIVSSSRNAGVIVEKLALSSRIDGLVDGNADARPKPFPDLFLLAAQQCGVKPEGCLVVEDAASGIEAAHAAGMRAVGLGPVKRVGAAELVLPSLKGQSAADIMAHLH